jgi:hypothetical protein
VLFDRNNLKDCGICSERSACGGCRARAFAYFNDAPSGDPGCGRNTDLWEALSATQAGQHQRRAADCKQRKVACGISSSPLAGSTEDTSLESMGLMRT